MRGVAAGLVLLHHAYGMAPDVASLGGTIDRLLHALMHFSPLRVFEFGRGPVLFFFVLSGYVLTRGLLRHGSPGLLAFAAQRSVRLLPPVAASVLLSVALWFLAFDPLLRQGGLDARTLGLWMQAPTLVDTLWEATLLQTDTNPVVLNPVLWSLVHEWRLTLFLPLVLLLRRQPALLLALASLATALGILGGAEENGVHLGPQLHSTVPASLYFTLAVGSGVALAMLGPIRPLGRWQRLAGLIAAVALFGMGSDIAAYAGSALLIVVAQQPGRLRRALRRPALVWLGRVSFSLYLVHAPVLVAWLFLLQGSLPFWAVLLSGILVVLACAALLHWLVEVPSRRLARQVERRLATRRPTDRAALDRTDAGQANPPRTGQPRTCPPRTGPPWTSPPWTSSDRFWASEGGMPATPGNKGGPAAPDGRLVRCRTVAED